MGMAMRPMYLLAPGVGAVAFWSVDILVHAIAATFRLGEVPVLLLTLLLPTLCCAGYWLLVRWHLIVGRLKHILLSILFVLGIWLAGPGCMSVGWRIFGYIPSPIPGDVDAPGLDLGSIGVMTLIFPLGTVMMATYDGTLWAVGIASAAVPALALIRAFFFQPR